MIPLDTDEVIVDLCAMRRVGKRPAEADRSIDAGRVHGGQQFVDGEDGAGAAMTHVEPRVDARKLVAGVAHARREDVHVAVDDHPSHRPWAKIHIPANISTALAPSIAVRARGKRRVRSATSNTTGNRTRL